MGSGRRIDDLKLKFTGGMEVVQLLQCGISVGTRELLSQIAVEGVIEDALPVGGFDKTLDQSVPCTFNIQHHRGQLQLRIQSGAREPSTVDPCGLAAQLRESKRIAEAP